MAWKTDMPESATAPPHTTGHHNGQQVASGLPRMWSIARRVQMQDLQRVLEACVRAPGDPRTNPAADALERRKGPVKHQLKIRSPIEFGRQASRTVVSLGHPWRAQAWLDHGEG